jgi:DNA-binding CsgD family transcriptional regulator
MADVGDNVGQETDVCLLGVPVPARWVGAGLCIARRQAMRARRWALPGTVEVQSLAPVPAKVRSSCSKASGHWRAQLVDRARNNVAVLEGTAGGRALECSASDFLAWLEALSLLPVAPLNESDIIAWVEGPLRRFFPFEKFQGGYGKMCGRRINALLMISSGHSPEFLNSLRRNFDLNVSACFAWWVSNRKPFLIDEQGALDEEGAPIPSIGSELDANRRFSLGLVAAHGVVDPFANTGTSLRFAGVPKGQPKRTFTALKLIAPVLHTLFLQTKQVEMSPVDLTLLTDRQRELVSLALVGLSDKAIAQRLAISDHTVGTHFRTIYAKLGISKRGQLIALLK